MWQSFAHQPPARPIIPLPKYDQRYKYIIRRTPNSEQIIQYLSFCRVANSCLSRKHTKNLTYTSEKVFDGK